MAPPNRRPARWQRACAEPLERRQLLAATWDEAIPQVVEGGYLEIGGRDLPDYVEIGSDGENLLVNWNGDFRKYVKSSVKWIAVYTGDGNDVVVIGNIGMGVYVEAGNDDDYMVGGDGADRILGCDGNDTTFGGGGNDYLDGGRQNDIINGGPGNDILLGDDGDDTLFGVAGNDRIEGGRGNDLTNGGPGHDRLFGGDGNDTLNGAAGNDILWGGAGNDILYGGKGRDRLYGEDGNDLFYDVDKTKDLIVGGAGTDRASADWTDTRREIERLFKMPRKAAARR